MQDASKFLQEEGITPDMADTTITVLNTCMQSTDIHEQLESLESEQYSQIIGVLIHRLVTFKKECYHG